MITIIVPAHNERENLGRLIPLLQKASGAESFELIIALSAKTSDESESILKEHGVPFIKCKQQGRATQMNEAAILAKGDILVFLHADVVPPESFGADIQKTIADGFDAGFFSYRFDSGSVFLKINASFTARDGIFTGGGDQCLFIKRTIFEQLNGFNEKQVLMEDFEFFDRMKKHNISYTIIKNDLIVSSRKYQYNSYVWVNFSNMLLMLLYKTGYPPVKLKTLHSKLLKSQH